nr:MAG TPA: hypothetical protein [Caudoviricetes sp.]
MSNPLMQFMGGGSPSVLPGPLGNMALILQQFQQFRASFKGDPKQQVEMLRKSGQMSDAQYQQLEAMAKQIMPFLK